MVCLGQKILNVKKDLHLLSNSEKLSFKQNNQGKNTFIK